MKFPRFVSFSSVTILCCIALVASRLDAQNPSPTTSLPKSTEVVKKNIEKKDSPTYASNLTEQRNELFKALENDYGLKDSEISKLKEIFSKSSVMGQGNPAVTKHPFDKQECLQRREKFFAQSKLQEVKGSVECGSKNMVLMIAPDGKKVCIDQYEFPNLPCEFPVVWTRADEAEEVCRAVGKRMCDAHEWEGACAGELRSPDYNFDKYKGLSEDAERRQMRTDHNKKEGPSKQWAYGPAKRKGVCAQASFKHDKCNGGNWKECGSNTYPVGSFPECCSKLGVCDQHGNAAEHMNLPLATDQYASDPSEKLGQTEMKGSWFIFDKYEAHEDWCRWRAPNWHGARVKSPKSHGNYHLGFRCCKDLGAK